MRCGLPQPPVVLDLLLTNPDPATIAGDDSGLSGALAFVRESLGYAPYPPPPAGLILPAPSAGQATSPQPAPQPAADLRPPATRTTRRRKASPGCPCPDDVDAIGKRCGGRCALYRAGGARPQCGAVPSPPEVALEALAALPDAVRRLAYAPVLEPAKAAREQAIAPVKRALAPVTVRVNKLKASLPRFPRPR